MRLILKRNVFKTLIRDGAIFLKVKRSTKVDTFNIQKNIFSYTGLRISRSNKNHTKQSDLGKSLDPTVYPILFRPALGGPTIVS